MRKTIPILFFSLLVQHLCAQNEVIFREIHIVSYELGKIPCSKGIRYQNGRYYYLRCEYGTEAQKKKLGRTEIDITTNLEVVNLIKRMAISDLEWLSGVGDYHKKKYRCTGEAKKDFSITLKDKDKKKTTRYDFPLVLNCEGKSPFNFMEKLNLIFSKLAKEFP